MSTYKNSKKKAKDNYMYEKRYALVKRMQQKKKTC